MIGIEMKLNIPVHYQMGNPLQVVIGFSFDSEQVFQVSNDTFYCF
jgi:hypothetical protein